MVSCMTCNFSSIKEHAVTFVILTEINTNNIKQVFFSLTECPVSLKMKLDQIILKNSSNIGNEWLAFLQLFFSIYLSLPKYYIHITLF